MTAIIVERWKDVTDTMEACLDHNLMADWYGETQLTLEYIQGEYSPHYPVPSTLGYVSLGQDYKGVVYIDSADHDDPQMVYTYDGWEQLIDAEQRRWGYATD